MRTISRAHAIALFVLGFAMMMAPVLLVSVLTSCVAETGHQDVDFFIRIPPITPTLPTPPTPLDGWAITIDGAKPEEAAIIRYGLEFLYSRDAAAMRTFVKNIEVLDDPTRTHFDYTIPDIAAHYEPDSKKICFLRGPGLTVHLLFHEVDHADTAAFLADPHATAIADWRKLVPGPYGIERYPENLVFPRLSFITRYSTRDDNECRAEWRRYIMLALLEMHEKSAGKKDAAAHWNPLRSIDKTAVVNRKILWWFLDHYKITRADYLALLPWFYE